MDSAPSSGRSAAWLQEPGSLTAAVVEAVADAEGTSPSDVRPPLAAVVDPDALERLVASLAGRPDSTGRVEFTYSGYEVSVTGDGVSVTEAEHSGADSSVAAACGNR